MLDLAKNYIGCLRNINKHNKKYNAQHTYIIKRKRRNIFTRCNFMIILLYIVIISYISYKNATINNGGHALNMRERTMSDKCRLK